MTATGVVVVIGMVGPAVPVAVSALVVDTARALMSIRVTSCRVMTSFTIWVSPCPTIEKVTVARGASPFCRPPVLSDGDRRAVYNHRFPGRPGSAGQPFGQ